MTDNEIRQLVREEAKRLLKEVVSQIPGTGDYIRANFEIALGVRPRR